MISSQSSGGGKGGCFLGWRDKRAFLVEAAAIISRCFVRFGLCLVLKGYFGMEGEMGFAYFWLGLPLLASYLDGSCRLGTLME